MSLCALQSHSTPAPPISRLQHRVDSQSPLLPPTLKWGVRGRNTCGEHKSFQIISPGHGPLHGVVSQPSTHGEKCFSPNLGSSSSEKLPMGFGLDAGLGCWLRSRWDVVSGNSFKMKGTGCNTVTAWQYVFDANGPTSTVVTSHKRKLCMGWLPGWLAGGLR